METPPRKENSRFGYPESPPSSLGYTPDSERGGDITPLKSPHDFTCPSPHRAFASQRFLNPSPLKNISFRAPEDSEASSKELKLTKAGAPTQQLRSSRNRSAHFDSPASNARNRTAAHQDHDIMAGLPVQNWTRKTVFVSQAPSADSEDSTATKPKSKWDEDLPMPSGSEFLPPHSRELLRLARRGITTVKSAWPGVKADKEPEEIPDKDENDETDKAPVESGFTVQKWIPVPRYDEHPFPKFIADRRKGLPALYGPAAGQQLQAAAEVVALPAKEVKVKKLDLETGASRVYKMLVAEGQSIDGEIVEDGPAVAGAADAPVTTEAPAAGTVVEGLGVANEEGVLVSTTAQAATPVKRRPPPPKRKAKGAHKGRKKKVMIAPGQGLDANAVHGEGGTPAGDHASGGLMGVDGAGDLVDGAEEEEHTEEEGTEEGESESGDESKSPSGAPLDDSTIDPAPETVVPPPADDQQFNLAPSEPPTIAEATTQLEAAVEADPLLPEAPISSETVPLPEPVIDEPVPQETIPPPPLSEPPPTSPIPTEAPTDPVSVQESLVEQQSLHPPEEQPAEVKPEEGEMDLLGSLEAELDENTQPRAEEEQKT